MIAGVSPRPANWILERSLDGISWQPWQYHAQSDEQCWLLYGMEPRFVGQCQLLTKTDQSKASKLTLLSLIYFRLGKPSYKEDDEVICTSYYSSLKPLEGRQLNSMFLKYILC